MDLDSVTDFHFKVLDHLLYLVNGADNICVTFFVHTYGYADIPVHFRQVPVFFKIIHNICHVFNKDPLPLKVGTQNHIFNFIKIHEFRLRNHTFCLCQSAYRPGGDTDITGLYGIYHIV